MCPILLNNNTSISPVFLERGRVKLGILPDVGGRIVYLSYNGSPNLLKSDPTQWNEPLSEVPVPGPDAPWKAYNGHIVWIGPQSAFWTDQDINPEKRDRKDPWPPDPWLIYGACTFIKKSPHSLVLKSPVSEVTGLQLTKTITINRNSTVSFEVEAQNMRNRPVSWDLWLNTRINGYAPAYVPVSSNGSVKIVSNRTTQNDTVPYSIERGFFHYTPLPPDVNFEQRSSKAFITPSEGYMYSDQGKVRFIIEFPLYSPNLTHPEQGMVEIYNYTSKNPDDALTEMEYHAPFRTLKTGEKMSTIQTWKFMEL